MDLFNTLKMKQFKVIIALLVVLTAVSGCVYYNMFYHARKNFNEAESRRKQLDRGQSARGLTTYYNTAIEKSNKVIDRHPNSKWYDDALFVNGVSNYYTENYVRAERRFREILANFPNSKYYKESRVYLAKTKLKLDEIDAAMDLFSELYYESKEKEVKSEAALALGEYYFEQKKYDEAEKYFRALVDSLGDNTIRPEAQIYIADAHMNRFNYARAIEEFQKVLNMKPSTKLEYEATFKMGQCYYFLGDTESGLEKFEYLAGKEIFFDSLASVRIKIAEGYEMDGDLFMAEATYERVAVEHPGRSEAALANFNLGLLYQTEYEDYKKAKEYYDKAKRGGGEIAQEALQRSTDIGKLEEYSKNLELDSTATREDYETAANTQYLLGELYLTQLSQPDSALQEFQIILDRFSDTRVAPQARGAIATIYRDYYDDTLTYDTTLRSILKHYPRSDFAPEIIDRLGLAGTIADTGYAAYYYRRAEKFMFDSLSWDSARHYLNFIVDSLPDSKLNLQARYALIWLTDKYEHPGDSSIYFAYLDFADSFPDNEFTTEIRSLVRGRPRQQRPAGETETGDSLQDGGIDEQGRPTQSADGKILTVEEKYYIDIDGNAIYDAAEVPIKVDREFRYPPAAYYLNFEGNMVLQIRIDAFGDVIDARLMNPSPSPELNDEVIETVLASHFSTGWIPPELFDSYFVYKFFVKLPESLK